MIKEEGKAGLLYAYSLDGVYTYAGNAKKGAKYTCPICGCPMHITTSRIGNKYFARDPGRQHTDPRCLTKEKKGIEYSFKGLDPYSFISSLCRVCSRKEKKNSEKSDAVTSSDINKSIKTDVTEYGPTDRPFGSLKQIANAGLDLLNPDDIQGDCKISDVILTFKYADRFLTNPNFTLGARIVYARFLWADNKNQALVFSLFSKGRYSVKFRLIFTSKKEFHTYRDKFGSYVENDAGKTVFKKVNPDQNVLIASDEWYKINSPDCKAYCNSTETFCNSCCGIYQSVFTNKKQLYIID